MKKRHRGFTLIEMLIVVAVVGVLGALAAPQFAEYRAKANDGTAEADARNNIAILRVAQK